jgi:hypothetical protein
MHSKRIVDHFGDLPDPREGDRRHLLLDSILMVIRALEGVRNGRYHSKVGQTWSRRMVPPY